MPYSFSLWDQAQGRYIGNYADEFYRRWPPRCRQCGRRLGLDDYVSVFVGEANARVVIHEVCSQHGGQHVDCLKGVDVDFGDGKSWPAIWASNLLHELAFWLKSVARFAWLALAHPLRIVMHPVRYRRYRQTMHEREIE